MSAAGGGGATGGGSAVGGGASGGRAGGSAGGTSGGVAGGSAGGSSGGTAGGAAGGDAGGVAGGDAGGVAGGAAGGSAGGDAGGSAGGTSGGSSGGMAGGSSGGSSGGTAGGSVVRVCPSNCPVFAPCEPSLDGGRCVNLTLSFTTPASLAIYDAGASVPVQVSARLRDGGAYVVTVPLTSSFGTNTTVTAGVSSPVSIPAIAGEHRLTAGWDGGPFDSVSVVATSCVASCQPWQTCRATIDGGACDSLNLTLTWTSPDAGLAFNTATVPARLTVTRSGGPVPASLTSVPLFGPLGVATPLSGGSGFFTGSLPMAAPEGNKTFIAGWRDGGPTASVTIERDTEAPGVELTVLPRPGSFPDPDPGRLNAWKKNETAIVRVDVDGGRPAVVADLSVLDSGVLITATGAGSCGCAANECRCFEVPLLRASDARGIYGIVGPIGDSAGNLSQPIARQIPSTRFLWSRSPSGTTPRFGLTESGLLLVSSLQGTAAAMHGIAPDGGTLWAWSSPGVTVSRPVIGASVAYVAISQNDGTSSIKAVSLATGLETATFCESNEAEPFKEPFALATTITGNEVPLAFRKGYILAGTGGCPSSQQFNTFSFRGIATQREPGGELGAYFIADSRVRKLIFGGLDFQDGGVNPTSNPSDVWLGPGTVWWSTASVLNVAATNAIETTTSSVGARLLNPMFTTNASWTVGDGFLERCGFDASFTFEPTCSAVPYPEFGAATGGVKTVNGFVANLNGEILDLREDGGISSRYSVEPTSELITDVPRGPTGAKACGVGLGIAYVTDSSDNVVAWLIDVQGLDGTAYWPRARHDNANSGNFNRSLAPWSCP